MTHAEKLRNEVNELYELAKMTKEEVADYMTAKVGECEPDFYLKAEGVYAYMYGWYKASMRGLENRLTLAEMEILNTMDEKDKEIQELRRKLEASEEKNIELALNLAQAMKRLEAISDEEEEKFEKGIGEK